VEGRTVLLPSADRSMAPTVRPADPLRSLPPTPVLRVSIRYVFLLARARGESGVESV
jgi:hypothetical protein